MKQLPDPSLPWPICMAAVALCADKEELRLKAYRCIAGKWTNGWGETDGVRAGMVWTKAYADQRFCDALTHYAGEVAAMCTEPPSANELGGLVVLGYNIGLEALRKSTVLRLHNAGDRKGAARAFGLFNKFHNPEHGGALEVSNGLTIRRAQEAALYLTPDSDAESPAAPMPQAVAAESSLVASPINAGGAVAAGGGALTLASQYGDQANGVLATLKTTAESLGVQLPVLLGIVLAVAGGSVVYWRWKQRQGGWA